MALDATFRSEKRTVPAAAGLWWVPLIAFAPVLVWWRSFSNLFWFGDDLDQIDQIDRLGFWHWARIPFTENFIPVFKLLWGAAFSVSHGSYWFMILLLWATHAANVFLLGRIMRWAGFTWVSSVVAQIAFGVSPACFESLIWSIQWSALLSVFFFLLALDGAARPSRGYAPLFWAAASTFSFLRGILSGPLVAFFEGRRVGKGRGVWIGRMAAYIVPAIALGLVAAFVTPGNQHHIRGHLADIFIYVSWYFALNPLRDLLHIESLGWHTVFLLGALKVALLLFAVCRSQGRVRRLLMVFSALDLGSALLTAVGRFHLGLESSIASRYQFVALLCVSPFLGLLCDVVFQRIGWPKTVKNPLGVLLLSGLVLANFLLWPAYLRPFSYARGTESRQLILGGSAYTEKSAPGIPFMTVAHARELAQKYSLH